MTDSSASLRRKIASAGDLESVVRTMKAMAASGIGQYENSVRSLDDYYRSIQLGLAVCNRNGQAVKYSSHVEKKDTGEIAAIVFGSDQGLVGQFNDVMAGFAVKVLGKLPGKKIVWAVGERIHSHLAGTDMTLGKCFSLPGSISTITPLVGQILLKLEKYREQNKNGEIYLFHHCPDSGAIYTPVTQRLLPLDDVWLQEFSTIRWPTKNLPETINERESTLQALVREYLFVSLFRACAESLASENASRLAAMQRAEKNIDELLENLNQTFHRLRQNKIDEELFDVVSGFEALNME
jgi:F-type H+-transporting ATPase subunit gamma